MSVDFADYHRFTGCQTGQPFYFYRKENQVPESS